MRSILSLALVTALLAGAALAAAQPSLVDVPLEEGFDGFTGAGFSPAPASGQLDSDAWIVSGVAAGDLAYGDTGASGAYAAGTASGAVTAAGVYAFEVAASDPALGLQPTPAELSPAVFETRFTNETGGALASFTVAYECWQWNDTGRAVDIDVEVVVGGVTTRVAALDCTGTQPPAATPSWVPLALGAVVTPASPVAAGAEVRVRFVVSARGGGADYDQVAIDDVTFGLIDTCGNGVDEAGDRCEDGNDCTTDSCTEPDGCTFTAIAGCDFDAGMPDDGGVDPGDGGPAEPRDADIPPRYDANMPPNGFERPDLGTSDGPEPDGCSCRTAGAPGAAAWPLLALLLVRRRRR